ncbi:hypothetical protein [Streptomyces sp. NPDC056948]|uniref:hypothetical protein n=1 Tax=Streptomyces sp. NPDC056948 TaxID=3345975 RepID=UPI00363D065C
MTTSGGKPVNIDKLAAGLLVAARKVQSEAPPPAENVRALGDALAVLRDGIGWTEGLGDPLDVASLAQHCKKLAICLRSGVWKVCIEKDLVTPPQEVAPALQAEVARADDSEIGYAYRQLVACGVRDASLGGVLARVISSTFCDIGPLAGALADDVVAARQETVEALRARITACFKKPDAPSVTRRRPPRPRRLRNPGGTL